MKNLSISLVLYFFSSYLAAQTPQEWLKKGNSKFDKGDYSGAILDFSNSIRQDTTDTWVNYQSYLGRARASINLGKLTDAIGDLTYVINRSEQNLKLAYFHRARATFRLKQYKESIDDYTRVIEIDKTEASAYNNRGYSKLFISDYQGALLDANQAIFFRPSESSFYDTRGEANYSLGNYSEAINDFTQAINLNKKLRHSYILRGLCYAYVFKLSNAQNDYQIASNIPDDTNESMDSIFLSQLKSKINNFTPGPHVEDKIIQKDEVIYTTLHDDNITSCDLSNNGDYILSGSEDMSIRLWDVSSSRLIRKYLGHENVINSVKFNASNSKFVSASNDWTAIVWDVSTGKILQKLAGHVQPVISAEFSPDGKYIITASKDKTAKIWDISTGQLVTTLIGHTKSLTSAKFSPNSALIATASNDNTIKLWRSDTFSQLFNLDEHFGEVKHINFSSDSKQLVSSSLDQRALVWLTSTGQLLANLRGHEAGVLTAEFSNDGRLILTGSEDKTARTWNASTGSLVNTYVCDRAVKYAKFIENNKSLLTITRGDYSDYRGSLCVWESSTGKPRFSIPRIDMSYAYDVKNRLYTFSEDKVATVDLISGQILSSKEGKSKINDAYFSPDSKFVVIDAESDYLRIINIATGENIVTQDDSTQRVTFHNNDEQIVLNNSNLIETSSGKNLFRSTNNLSIVPSPKLNNILLIDEYSIVKLWDIKSNKLIQRIGNSRLIPKFSSNGKHIISFRTNSLKVWNGESGTFLYSLDNLTDLADAIFSNEGKFIYTLSNDSVVNKWETASGKLITKFESKNWIRPGFKLSIDQKYLAAVSTKPFIQIWNTESGAIHNTIKNDTSEVRFIEFTAMGKLIIIDESGFISVWDPSHKKEILKNHVGATDVKFDRSKKSVTLSLGTDVWLYNEITNESVLLKNRIDITNSNNYSLRIVDNRIDILSNAMDKEILSWVNLGSGKSFIRHPLGLIEKGSTKTGDLYHVNELKIKEIDESVESPYESNLWEKVIRGDKLRERNKK